MGLIKFLLAFLRSLHPSWPLSSPLSSNNHLMTKLYPLPGRMQISLPSLKRGILLRWTVPTWPELVHSTHSSFSVAHLSLTRTSILFFVRTVPAWNSLFPASVCADSVAVFHSINCNNFMYWWFFFIWLVILFVFFFFILCIYFAVNVMSFRVLTVHCQISSLEVIVN